jgi:hypothetical protein
MSFLKSLLIAGVLALGVVIYNSGGPWRKVLVLNRDAKRCFLSDSSISSDNLSAGTLLVMVDPHHDRPKFRP